MQKQKENRCSAGQKTIKSGKVKENSGSNFILYCTKDMHLQDWMLMDVKVQEIPCFQGNTSPRVVKKKTMAASDD